MSDHGHIHRAHSLLSSSGSDRWMHCTPSARKEEHLESEESDYAKEGTLAHELSEIELLKYFKLITDEEYNIRLKVIEAHRLYNDEMPEFVAEYVDYCIQQYHYYKSVSDDVQIFIEDKIDLTEFIPDGGGTNDFVILTDYFIEVIDLKYGRGVAVSAINNTQLRLYGVGSVFRHKLNYHMKEIKMTIVQPRIGNISSDEISVEELEHWAYTEVTEKAKMAYAGEGELNPGSWCKWCKFKPKCRAVYEQNIKLAKLEFQDPDEITEDEIRKIFEKREEIISWIDSINSHVMSKLMRKEPFGDYKLVKGRSTRKIVNPEKVIEILDKEYDESLYMTAPKLLGITAIEKLVGKKNIDSKIGQFIEKTDSKPTIALLSDSRADFFDSAADVFDDETPD